MRYAAIALLLLVGQPAGPRPSFEVATIKRNVSGAPGGGGGFRAGGRFQMTNVSVDILIRIAYRQGAQLLPSQIVGGPEWMRSDAYDIVATAGSDFAAKTPAELLPVQPLLLQSLLEDRFKLKVHRETRELQRYALVRARKDGTLGPQLRLSRLDCSVDFTKCSIRVGRSSRRSRSGGRESGKT